MTEVCVCSEPEHDNLAPPPVKELIALLGSRFRPGQLRVTPHPNGVVLGRAWGHRPQGLLASPYIYMDGPALQPDSGAHMGHTFIQRASTRVVLAPCPLTGE